MAIIDASLRPQAAFHHSSSSVDSRLCRNFRPESQRITLSRKPRACGCSSLTDEERRRSPLATPYTSPASPRVFTVKLRGRADHDLLHFLKDSWSASIIHSSEGLFGISPKCEIWKWMSTFNFITLCSAIFFYSSTIFFTSRRLVQQRSQALSLPGRWRRQRLKTPCLDASSSHQLS